MLMVVLIISLLLIAVTLLLFFRDYYVSLKLQRLALLKYQALKALLEKLASNNPITPGEVFTIAQSPSLRITVFRMLEAQGLKQLFPLEFYSEEKGAEGHMVNWLEFPTELGQAPTEIILMKIVPIELQIQVHYYAFKFRATSPRWAKKLNWMIGICGPYDEMTKPFDSPLRVFSRFNQVGIIKPEAEVQWVHENINP
jgi:hypothetical protein